MDLSADEILQIMPKIETDNAVAHSEAGRLHDIPVDNCSPLDSLENDLRHMDTFGEEDNSGYCSQRVSVEKNEISVWNPMKSAEGSSGAFHDEHPNQSIKTTTQCDQNKTCDIVPDASELPLYVDQTESFNVLKIKTEFCRIANEKQHHEEKDLDHTNDHRHVEGYFNMKHIKTEPDDISVAHDEHHKDIDICMDSLHQTRKSLDSTYIKTEPYATSSMDHNAQDEGNTSCNR